MSQTTGKTVLIVDDEADTVRFLAMAVEDAGFEVMTASDGVEAIEKIKEKTPDLISLDIVMPKGGGIRCFRELQKNPAWSKIPVIVVTARDLGLSMIESEKGSWTEDRSDITWDLGLAPPLDFATQTRRGEIEPSVAELQQGVAPEILREPSPEWSPA
jgi:CheY-like chemotaxis protein